MSAEIIDNSAGTLTVRISGLLKQPDLSALQKTVGELLSRQGRTNILVLTEAFEGWQRGGAWGDVSFSVEHDKSIEKMAIVGERQWEDLALMFASKGLRSFPIEYFLPSEIKLARDWLSVAGRDSPSR